jgi:hypothetical protein
MPFEKLELYISAFDSQVTANAAVLPSTFTGALTSYDVLFTTQISTNLIAPSFMFTKNGDDLSIVSYPIDKTAILNDTAGFSIPNSVFSSIGISDNAQVYFSSSSGSSPNSAPVLTDDYLGYIAKYELGSQYLVGAFDNISQIISPLTSDVVLDTMVTALTGHSFDISSFATSGMTGDYSAIWSAYSLVFDWFPYRISTATDGVPTSLLQTGDTIYVKMTVSTPALDSSIVPNAPQINADMPSSSVFTPSRPSDRVYLIGLVLV